jgi:hypothetical protein
MNYKYKIVCVGVIAIIALAAVDMSITYSNINGKESARYEILERCKNHQVVTINNIEIHCGIIHKEVNQEAAKYRGIKRCINLIGKWNDDQY